MEGPQYVQTLSFVMIANIQKKAGTNLQNDSQPQWYNYNQDTLQDIYCTFISIDMVNAPPSIVRRVWLIPHGNIVHER